MAQQLHDSGERREFKTGAVRDRGDLKPRPDLISPHANMREGMINTLGSIKYDVRNWEQGMPLSVCIASAQRHIEQWKLGMTDEDHIAQARWNLGAIIHFEEEIKAGRLPAELDDMPRYARQPMLTPAACSEDTNLERRKQALLNRLNAAIIPVPPVEMAAPNVPVPSDEPKHYYVAGPMRGYEFLNFPLFDKVSEVARAQGFDITSPAELDRDHGIDPINDPESVDRANAADPNLLQTIVRRDCEVILNLKKDRGDGLILLPGWPKSTGTRAEVALAVWMGLSFKQVSTKWHGQPHELEIMDDIPIEQIRLSLFHQPIRK